MPGPLVAAGVGKAAVGKAATAGFSKTLTGSIGAGLGKLADSQFGKSFDSNLAQGSAQSISGMLQDQGGKLLGIPTQDEKLLNTMDKLYPGTNPWERLGGVGSGVASQALQSKVTREKFKNDQSIAKVRANAQIKSSTIQAQGAVEAAKQAAAPKLQTAPSEIQRNLADARSITEQIAPRVSMLSAQAKQAINHAMLLAAQGDIEQAAAKFSTELATARISAAENQGLAFLANAMRNGTFTEADAQMFSIAMKLVAYGVPGGLAVKGAWSLGRTAHKFYRNRKAIKSMADSLKKQSPAFSKQRQSRKLPNMDLFSK